jgi:predicted NAD-dependent protein-ADP-ribosyltransferase YbiA (DUF1768 family)
MIVTMVINEVRAAHELYEALLSREYDFNQLMADISMSMNHDIIEVVHAVKSPDVDFDMGRHVQQFDYLMYKIHSILMIETYLNREDVEEMISGIEKQLVKRIDQLIEEYSA